MNHGRVNHYHSGRILEWGSRHIEATPIGEQQVAFEPQKFSQVREAVEAVARDIADTLERVKPDKASVKFGLEIGIETTGLMALIAKGTGKANLEITLQWGA